MRLIELIYNEDGIRFRHVNPSPLSAEQKYHIIMALIGTAAAFGFFGLLGTLAVH